jgi:hypothetical protein
MTGVSRWNHNRTETTFVEKISESMAPWNASFPLYVPRMVDLRRLDNRIGREESGGYQQRLTVTLTTRGTVWICEHGR